MFAQLRHVAIVSDHYALEGKFYQAVFGMTTADDTRPERAVTVSDGYVGLNINPRKAGRPGGLDHFGLEVQDVDAVRDTLARRYPEIEVLQRPATRPFAGLSTHDADGNVFDLSQQGMENRTSVYVERLEARERAVDHLALRTLHPERLAEFYHDVYGLELLPRTAGDGTFRLSDGRVTLMLMPWRISDYAGTGVVRPGPDHIGFKVESVAAVQERLARLGEDNPHLRGAPLGAGREGRARVALFEACGCGAYHFADVDGVLLDISERAARVDA